MASQELQAETLEERLIYWSIVSTWGIWLLGGLYILGPVLGFGLLGLLMARALGLTGEAPITPRLTFGMAAWAVGMMAMLVALVIAHLDFELGMGQMIKSSIGWAKGWALLAVFIVVGGCLDIRPEIVYRATGLLAAQTLVLAPIFLLSGFAGLPMELYVSPLSIVGGPGPEFFDVSLYAIDDTTHTLRWRFFAPWATAAAFMAAIWFVFALYERRTTWKLAGLAASLVVCVMAGSRLSVIAVPAIVGLVVVTSNIRRPELLLAVAVGVAVLVLSAEQLAMIYQDVDEAFTSARAASSRVRATLASMAYHRWETEAPVFGHGVVERGPHLVEFMMIGSHHTWHGLLFVKGLVGMLGLALPLAWSIVELGVKAQVDRVARAGLGVLLALVLFSFGDNLEIVAYLIWPGLVVVGIAHRRRFRSPYVAYLGLERA